MIGPETWFWIAHVPALAGWIALIALPAGRGVPLARWAVVALAAGYAILFFAAAPEGQQLARGYSLEGIAAFFADREPLLLLWVHHLAFGLFVGSWEAEEGARLGVPKRTLVPCLLLTLLLGPLGLLAFLAARWPRTNSIAS